MRTRYDIGILARLPRMPGLRRVALIGLVLVAGCSITEPSRRVLSTNDLERNRQRWTALGLRDYEFDYQLLCYCLVESTESVHITVRGNAIASVRRTRDGMPAANRPGGWPRVEELFAEVQRRLDEGADRLDVEYDPTYGYPRSISVDAILLAVDDEARHIAKDLRPLP